MPYQSMRQWPCAGPNIAEIRARFDRTGAAVPADLSAVTRLYTAGAWLLASSGPPILGDTDAQGLLLAAVRDALPPDVKVPPRKVHHRTPGPLAGVGKAVSALFATVAQGLGFVGIVVARLAGLLVRPWRLRLTAVVHHMQQVGLNAVPIVALMGFLIGVVLAFQGPPIAPVRGGGLCRGPDRRIDPARTGIVSRGVV